MTFNPISAFFVLPVMLVLIELGRRFRIKHKAPQESTAIESAIFALFGLLLAFTFSGAVERYDRHRELLVEETNAIGTAYLRLDLPGYGASTARDLAAVCCRRCCPWSKRRRHEDPPSRPQHHDRHHGHPTERLQHAPASSCLSAAFRFQRRRGLSWRLQHGGSRPK